MDDYWQQLKAKVREFFNLHEENFPQDLGRALYVMSELNMWPDNVNNVSVEQAFMIWQVVERVRAVGFPDELRL